MLNKRLLFSVCLVLLLAVMILLTVDQRDILFLARFTILVLLAVTFLVFFLEITIGAGRSKTLLANLLLLGITVTACLVAAEVAVRHYFADISSTIDNTSYFALRWNSTHPPYINELGFREREIKKQKPPGVYRIIVVGDSFTYGQGLAEDDRFTNIIERQLNKDNNSYEVLNFGKPGAETIDQIGFLDTIFGLNPDFILLQWFPNDVEGRDKSGRPQPYQLVPSDYLSGLLHRHSALYYLVNTKFKELQSKIGLIESHENSMLVRFNDPESQDSRRAIRELDDFIRRVQEKHIPTGIVMFPHLVEAGGAVDNYPYGFLFDRVADACKRFDIHCLDMRPVLVGISPATRLWVNRLDAHPSRLANEMAAEAILEMYGSQW